MKSTLARCVWWLLTHQLRAAAMVMRGLGERTQADALDRDAHGMRHRGTRHLKHLEART